MVTDVAVATTKSTDPPFPYDRAKGRDELNLIDLPLTLPESKRRQLAKEGIRTYTFSTPEVWDHDLQQHVVRTVEIIPSPDLGFPSTFDNRVLLASTSLAKWKCDLEKREVPFSARLLLDILRLPRKGQNYTRVRESMERWQSTDFRITYPWYDKRNRKRKALHRFNLFDNVIWDAKDADEESLFVLNEVLFQSLTDKFIRTVDLDQHGRFKSHFAGEAYRLLGKLFYQNPVQEMPLEQFAFHVAAGECADNGQMKRKLRPAIEELEAEGIIVPLAEKQRYHKVGRGDYTIRFEQPGARGTGKQAELFGSPICEELTSRGVEQEIAEKLVDKYTDEQIAYVIEWVEWFDKEKPGAIKSLPAYLVTALTRPVPAPPTFKTKTQQAEEAKRAKASAAKRRRKLDDEQLAREKVRQAQLAQRDNENQQVADYLSSLDETERVQLINAAIAKDELGMARKYRDQIDTGEFHQWAYEAALHAHIYPLLKAEAAA